MNLSFDIEESLILNTTNIEEKSFDIEKSLIPIGALIQYGAVKVASPGKTTTCVFNEIILKRVYIINII